MSFNIKTNLGGRISAAGNSNRGNNLKNLKPQQGKVFGVITTENTPTKELFEKYGKFSGMGTIFYLDYDGSKNIDKVDLTKCKTALPYDNTIQNFPLIGEIVWITDGVSPISQLSNTATQKYYIGIVNSWNNDQHNALSGDTLGKSYIEKADTRKIKYFEGHKIIKGRSGNGIRFGSTVKYHSNENEWSSGPGPDGDPITIMVNGYITTDTGSSAPNIEEISKEMSSLYMTSTQIIPLLPDRNDILNPLTNPLLPNKYLFSQIIMNSDRITLNSKKDEVMIFAKTNIEINTKNTINLNASGRVHLNTPYTLLGTKPDGTAAYEPLLLGNKTKALLTQLMSILSELGNTLTSVVSTPKGSPLIGVNTAGSALAQKIEILQQQLKDITSNNNFTI